MSQYLLELYVSAAASSDADAGVDRVREAAGTLAAQGTPVRVERAMFVVAEETCFVLLEADAVETVHDVARLARVAANRVSQVADGPGYDDGPHEDADRPRPTRTHTDEH